MDGAARANKFNIWPILRDVIIVTVFSLFGGFIVGFTATDHNSRLYFYALALSNSVFCIIGFTISGCLAVGNRWRHLACVAAIAWTISIYNVIFFDMSTIKWAATAIFIAIFALIGGGVSLLLKKQTIEEGNHNQTNTDLQFYEQVAIEMKEKPLSVGLWTKAFAEMDGDDAKTRALYIKYRVAQLMEANRQQREEEGRIEKQRQRGQQRSVDESLTFELFERGYNGEGPLNSYTWYEQQDMFKAWRKQRLEARGFGER